MKNLFFCKQYFNVAMERIKTFVESLKSERTD